ncbi:hypothetical protein [Sporosarcina sp. OR05]|uniref:hypothetical protein n=1 Tax=Sporosarcina sp. OR05 TaxID=2969819 RepID=UPI00352B7D46
MPSAQSNWYIRFGCLAPIIGIGLLVYLLNTDAIIPGFTFFALFFGFGVLFLNLSIRAEQKVKQKQLDYLNSFKPTSPNYNESHAFVSYDLLSKIAVDEKNRRIYFWEPETSDGKPLTKAYLHMPYTVKSYTYQQLLAVELFENGTRQQTVVNEAPKTIERIEELGQSVEQIITNKSTLIRKVIYRKVATLEMKVLLDDEEKPYRIVRFYSNLDKRLKRKSASYTSVKQDAEHWISLLTFVMNQK